MLRSKTLILLLLLFVCIAAVSCLGLQAKSQAAARISEDAANFKTTYATTQEAVPIFLYNSERFAVYNDGATINLFAWLFDAKKTILCTPRIYSDLENHASLAAENASRVCRASTQPVWPDDLHPKMLLENEKKWMQDIERERAGK
jgi:hypothetical protein